MLDTSLSPRKPITIMFSCNKLIAQEGRDELGFDHVKSQIIKYSSPSGMPHQVITVQQ
jgi:hypothetical protein